MALAKKCEKLYDSLVTANNERNRLFGLLYGHYIRLGDLKKTFDIADGHDIELWITPDGKLFGKKERR